MVADVGDDVEAEAAVGGDAVVEGGEEGDDEGLEVGALAAGAEADAGEEVGGRLASGVDAEVDPGGAGLRLEGADDRGFAGAGGAVEDDDLAGGAARAGGASVAGSGVRRRPGQGWRGGRRGWRGPAAHVGEGDAELAFGGAVAALGQRGAEHGAGEDEEGEVADEEGGEFAGGEGVGVLDIGEVGAAAEELPAGQRGDGGGDGVAAAEDFEALAATQSARWRRPQRAAFWRAGGADGDGVEDLLGLGEAVGGGDDGAGAVAGEAEGLGEGIEVDEGVAPGGVGEEGMGAVGGGMEVAVGLVEDEGDAGVAGDLGEFGDEGGGVFGAVGLLGVTRTMARVRGVRRARAAAGSGSMVGPRGSGLVSMPVMSSHILWLKYQGVGGIRRRRGRRGW